MAEDWTFADVSRTAVLACSRESPKAADVELGGTRCTAVSANSTLAMRSHFAQLCAPPVLYRFCGIAYVFLLWTLTLVPPLFRARCPLVHSCGKSKLAFMS
jgi:hypothetical protein